MFTIREACAASDYEALRKLWCENFGDSPEYVDAFYANWSDAIKGYVLEDDGEIVSALTQFYAGELVIPSNSCAALPEDAPGATRIPVYVSYAICTASSARGKGFGSAITEYARDVAVHQDAVSVLSPAEPSLVNFYRPLGYEPQFLATEISLGEGLSADLDSDSGTDPGTDRIDLARYIELREMLLANTAHIVFSEKTWKLIESESEGFYSLMNGRIIVCVGDKARMLEAIASPELETSEFAKKISTLAAALGMETFSCRCPADAFTPDVFASDGIPDRNYVQAMIAGERIPDFGFGYYGFPLD